MRSFADQGVVLKKLDFGEAGRILTLFTRKNGKIKVLAKGVRRPTSRKGGHLDLLTQAKVFVNRGKNLDLVTQAETVNSFYRIKKDVKDISKAYYLCELVDSLCAEGQNLPFVFDLLVLTLEDFLPSTNRKIWGFEYQLLKHLGFITHEKPQKGLKNFVEEIIERELKTPKFYYSLLKL